MFNVTHDYVVGQLKLLGSQDRQVLESCRQQLVQQQQPMKLGSLGFLILGGVLTITIIGALVGVPMLVIAGWVQWKARANIATIDAASQAYLAHLSLADPQPG